MMMMIIIVIIIIIINMEYNTKARLGESVEKKWKTK